MKAIFFDTNVFYGIKFDVDDELMTNVIDLANTLNIELWISPITIEEIKAGIDKKLDDLLNAYSIATPLLKHTLEDKELFEKSLIEKARVDLNEQLDLFIEQHRFKVLNYDLLDESDISKTFQDYFLQTGAFTPKKRSKNARSKEFPDAFQIELVRRAAKCSDSVSIVSGDGDFTQSLSEDESITLYSSLKSLYKTLNDKSTDSIVEISRIENRVIYHLDDYETSESIFSHLSFYEYNDITQEQVSSALQSLHNKNLIDSYIYSPESGEYVQANAIEDKVLWFKQRI